MRVVELTYHPDSAALFAGFAAEPWSVWLDSGGASGHGRWDVLAARPYATLVSSAGVTEYRQGSHLDHLRCDPLEVLRTVLDARTQPQPWPFCGGAIGYFAYDLARQWTRLPNLARDTAAWPDMAMGLYDWAVLVDHHQRRSWLIHAGRASMPAETWQDLVALFRQPARPDRRSSFAVRGAVEGSFSAQTYRAAFDRVQAYIRAGDCYQVNLAQRFTCPVEGDPWAAYLALRRINPAPFSAYFSLPWGALLSSSPERFLRVRQGIVETRPIKGTRRRSPDGREDTMLREALQSSVKDRAENLMIVDLLRNDLGRVCTPGSVQVPELFRVESFASVHHLVSTVTGRLRDGEDAVSLLRAAFPGGSITGAPKLRAMQIIEELEPHRRGVYCGAIGYLGFDGSMDTNIAIRTLTWRDGILTFWAGGGIVADSHVDAEYQECLDKAAAVFQMLTSHVDRQDAQSSWWRNSTLGYNTCAMSVAKTTATRPERRRGRVV